ncbi:hypothetical protein HYC85_012716 [Camellia sinensis]|uniref:Uncharacterized protein n=1 Tax=Camellia sinensis TaxID=4442 RepID=A0A7J7HCQ0_CAMSI|nr:hypothetical protein HYC85_012716 [Camellia sinensis]
MLVRMLRFLMKWVGITKASFRLTNKAIDQEKLKKYEKGKFDFKGAEIFMVPLTILVILNIVCFIGGAKMGVTTWYQSVPGSNTLGTWEVIRITMGRGRGRRGRQEMPLPEEVPAVQEGVGQANVAEPAGQ